MDCKYILNKIGYLKPHFKKYLIAENVWIKKSLLFLEEQGAQRGLEPSKKQVQRGTT